MKTLNQFVTQVNTRNNMFGNYRPLDLKLAKDRQAVADELDMRLSPENLSCDGELRGKALQDKVRFLRKAAAELVALDPSVQMYEYA